MILFIISCVFILSSSYLLSAILAKSNAVKGFIYTLLIAFAQIILTSEILSPFNQIKELPFLLLNFVFLGIVIPLWLKQEKPLWKFDLTQFKQRFFNALKLDKSLWFLFISWIIFIISAIYLIILLPVTSGDGYSYHVVRSIDWVINHSMSHFDTHDIRIIAFPINSEILYMWVLLFTKKQLCLGIFSFIGYILTIINGYHILRFLGFSMRKILWTLFIVSSFASVIVMASGTETDLIISGLILTSIYLFIDSIKHKSHNTTIFMASLAYAIAIGVKTPAIICIPAVGLLFLYYSFKFNDKKTLLKFIGFGIINFILFSAFNYVQNFISFGNFMGAAGSINTHKNLWGIQGFVASFVKHLFLFVDFSGFKFPILVFDDLITFEKQILTLLKVNNVPNGLYCGNAFFNSTLVEPFMGCGILSFLLVLPCFLISLIKPVFCRKNKNFQRLLFALVLITNIAVLSAVIAFMTYNTRFLTSFVLISMPIFTYSYIKSNKNIIKIFFILIAIFYFTIISTHLWGRSVFIMTKGIIKNSLSIKDFRGQVQCDKYDKRSRTLGEWCNMNYLIISKFADKKHKILFLPSYSEDIIFVKTLVLQGHKFDFKNLEHLKSFNPKDYDAIIIPNKGQAVTKFDKYTPDSIDYILYGPENHYPKDPNAEILCYYNGLDSTLSKEYNTENQIPHQKVCKITTNFLKNHSFDIKYKTKGHFILLNKKYQK